MIEERRSLQAPPGNGLVRVVVLAVGSVSCASPANTGTSSGGATTTTAATTTAVASATTMTPPASASVASPQPSTTAAPSSSASASAIASATAKPPPTTTTVVSPVQTATVQHDIRRAPTCGPCCHGGGPQCNKNGPLNPYE